MESQGFLGVEGTALLVASPQSEAVTHEMEELSLQPHQNLPPLNERKNVLQLRLQQRRTREELVDQGIMPPLKSPAAFHGQIRSLERARTENFLKHKIRSRPERSELVRMHILQETGAEPSLQATQMKLKRARLADNLNEKISQRPGPMELVEKNILPVDSNLKDAIIGQVTYPKVVDEDSCDTLSPEQPASQESQSSMPSPGDIKFPETPSIALSPPGPTLKLSPQYTTDATRGISTREQPTIRPVVSHPQAIVTAAPSRAPPTLVKQSQHRMPSEKIRSKKGKDAKPRVRKLKYHQYVPPDQKLDLSEASMDSSYARLLQQQQLFLQLQILSQQQQHYNYQTILPAPLKPVAEGQSANPGGLPASIVVSLPTAAPPMPLARQNHSLSHRKPGVLPANLEEMKVAELKLELKLRGLPVSGTKTDLMERLRPFQDPPSSTAPPAPAVPMETAPGTPPIVRPPQQGPPERANAATPPVSPVPNGPFAVHHDAGASEVKCEMPLAYPGSSPLPKLPAPEKDRRLHEKERQIEELMRKLEHEQKLVEELKMQLEVEKRSQGSCSPGSLGNSISASQVLPKPPPQTPVKLEDVTVSSGKPHQPQLVSRKPVQVQQSPQLNSQPPRQAGAPNLQQFVIGHPGGMPQVLGRPQTLLTASGPPPTLLAASGQTGTQILLPVSLPNNGGAIQLPSTTVSLQPLLQASVSNPGLVQASIPQLQNSKMDLCPKHNLTNNNSLLQTLTMCNKTSEKANQSHSEINPQCFLRSSPDRRSSPCASPNHATNGPLDKSPSPQLTFILQPSTLLAPPPKAKEPPRYEDAVKQTRNLHLNNVSQVATATSQQHMDDLFDILIQSGEITPFTQHEPPTSVHKSHPVTANISTLPVNTVLSRQPPQIQLAPPPASNPDPGPPCQSGPPNLSSLSADNQLEAFLERTLADSSDPRTRGLMEELQAQLMEHQPYSPMDTSELSFCDSSSPPPSLNLALLEPGLDNMEWLDLTAPPGIPADFLDAHDLQLHWD
ncbi:myocardin-related transcription factor B [Stigmatopora nigra]